MAKFWLLELIISGVAGLVAYFFVWPNIKERWPISAKLASIILAFCVFLSLNLYSYFTKIDLSVEMSNFIGDTTCTYVSLDICPKKDRSNEDLQVGAKALEAHRKSQAATEAEIQREAEAVAREKAEAVAREKAEAVAQEKAKAVAREKAEAVAREKAKAVAREKAKAVAREKSEATKRKNSSAAKTNSIDGVWKLTEPQFTWLFTLSRKSLKLRSIRGGVWSSKGTYSKHGNRVELKWTGGSGGGTCTLLDPSTMSCRWPFAFRRGRLVKQ